MTNQEIFDLIDRFERGSISTMKLSTQDFSLELSRESAAPAPAAPPTALSCCFPAGIFRSWYLIYPLLLRLQHPEYRKSR